MMVSYLGGVTGGVMLFAAVAKLLSRADAVSFVKRLGVPVELSKPGTYALIGAEMVIGCWAVSGLAPVWAATSLLLLLFALAGVTVVAELKGVSSACGCFGALEGSASRVVSHVRLALLILAAAGFLVAGLLANSVDRSFDARLTGIVSAIVFVVVSSLFGRAEKLVTGALAEGGDR